MELQSVSAGSGKTFHLARTFIRDFLTYHRDVDASRALPGEKVWEGSVRRYVLREPRELREAHSHILAITFTNKATNEMKERIVEKLADLARGHRIGSTADNPRPPEYLDFFLNHTVTADGSRPTVGQVMASAREALAELLNAYTDFNISTIDSFFQQMLRTFVYELGLNDNLELELDTDLLIHTGIDMALRSANHAADPAHNTVIAWIKGFIAECQARGARWDILSRKKPGAFSSADMRADLLNVARHLCGEKLHNTMERLRDYFRSPDWKGTGLSGTVCFDRYYRHIRDHYAARVQKEWDACLEALARADSLMSDYGASDADLLRGVPGVLKALRVRTPGEIKWPETAAYALLCDPSTDFTALFAGKSKLPAEARRPIGDAVLRAARCSAALRTALLLQSDIAGRLFYVGLMGAIADSMEGFREANNLLPLSNTNHILRKIVGSKDDAPFIFERMGSMLSHFLIDEFQDTAGSQWEVMRPLLEDADSRGFDNLIIGDAKQSIYRFRDAEPELITTGVRRDFPYTNARDEAMPNKNWRSSATVVDFNNRFFRLLASDIHSQMQPLPGGIPRRSPADIYGNVAQQIQHADKQGYVQVTFTPRKEYLEELPSLIARLLEQGWHQRDIAVLCDTNKECHKVIDALMARSADAPALEIMSEEALSVNESVAVKMILAALDVVAKGNPPVAKDEESSSRDNLTPQALEIAAASQFAAGRLESVADFAPDALSDILAPERIDALLRSMPAISLPAIVDAIVAAPDFMPPSLRVTDAAYIAAFQDTVLDFCDRFPADPASFMKWWEQAGHKVTVAAPEGADALTVMTVHKSKGLEFGVVIIPMADWEIDISHRDKTVMWVSPDPEGCPDPRIMPPAVPVAVGSARHEMVQSPYAVQYIEEYDRSRIDKLNEAYVAFTRAGGELYINAPLSKKELETLEKGKLLESASLAVHTYRMLSQLAADKAGGCSFVNARFTAGTPGAAAGCPRFRKELPAISDDDIVREYYVNAPMPRLRAVAGDDESGPVASGYSAPRDFGTILHAVLAGMSTPDDLQRSILRLQVRGLLPDDTADKCRRRILSALEIPEAAAWFAPGVSVLSERTVYRGDGRACRADRVVDTGSELIVIDYKTGQSERPREYFPQVKAYMARYADICRELGMQRRVTGKILLIPADESIPCSIVDVDS